MHDATICRGYLRLQTPHALVEVVKGGEGGEGGAGGRVVRVVVWVREVVTQARSRIVPLFTY